MLTEIGQLMIQTQADEITTFPSKWSWTVGMKF